MDASRFIRENKVQEAKYKILNKLYDTKEFKEEMVNKLVQSEDLRNAVHNLSLAKTRKAKSQSVAGLTSKPALKTNWCVRDEKIKEAKERIERGYYNNQEIFSKVAQKLIESLGM
jgi:anti-sigma28 factor (negative regulator of flagellin synthesis)